MIAREVERSGKLKKYKVLISFNVMMNQMWVNIWGFSKCTPGRKMKRREDRNDNRRAHDGLDETFLSVGGEAEAKAEAKAAVKEKAEARSPKHLSWHHSPQTS